MRFCLTLINSVIYDDNLSQFIIKGYNKNVQNQLDKIKKEINPNPVQQIKSEKMQFNSGSYCLSMIDSISQRV